MAQPEKHFAIGLTTDEYTIVKRSELEGLQLQLQLTNQKLFEERERFEKEKEDLRNNHLAYIQEKEKEHKTKITELENRIQELEALLRENKVQFSVMNARMQNLEGRLLTIDEDRTNERLQYQQELRKVQEHAAIKQQRLLLGQTAYTFLNYAVSYVFAGEDNATLNKLKRRVSSLDDLQVEAAKASETLKNRFDQFVNDFCNSNMNDMDDILDTLKFHRKHIAHPTSEEDDTEEVITPARLTEIAQKIYKQKRHKPTKEGVIALITHLDKLAQHLGKDLLEL